MTSLQGEVMDAQTRARPKVSSSAATSLEPLRVTVATHSQALALSREMAELGRVEVQDGTGAWTVYLHGSTTDGILVKALEAVRRSLAAGPGASAEILLDGNLYRMEAE
jgi:hypothetical protein